MSNLYNTQEEIASKIKAFLLNVFPNFRKTQLNIIPYIIIGMLLSHSIVSSNIAKSLKGKFSFIQFDSIVRRIRRFFSNKLFNPYFFYETIIKFIISHYKLKHSDHTIFISFDHTYSNENYTILLFSMKVGKQGIPIFFRCFDGINNPNAYLDTTITDAIKTVSSYFSNTNYKLVFLADRWFNSENILKTIHDLGHIYCIRFKGNIKVRIFDKKENHYIYKYSGELTSTKYQSKYYHDVYLYENSSFMSNICISRTCRSETPWIIVTNGNVNRAIRRYSYRFGSIETIFKNQKSNCFSFEKICNANIKAFTSMFSLLCFSILFLTIIGADYSKNTKCYKNVKIVTHKMYKGIKTRVMSLFKIGLTLFHLAYNSQKYIRLPMNFILYDI